MFCSYVSDGRYGWVPFCEKQFGDVPSQICFELQKSSAVVRVDDEPGDLVGVAVDDRLAQKVPQGSTSPSKLWVVPAKERRRTAIPPSPRCADLDRMNPGQGRETLSGNGTRARSDRPANATPTAPSSVIEADTRTATFHPATTLGPTCVAMTTNSVMPTAAPK